MARVPWSIDDLPEAIRNDPRNRAALGLHTNGPTPPQAPEPPAMDLLRLEGQLLTNMRRVAKREGWEGLHTYNALGPDHGLHVILVRDVVIFADLKNDGEALTPTQERWRNALRQVGGLAIEAYTWTPAMWPAIHARLSQPRTP
jgi:hypothetical protein